MGSKRSMLENGLGELLRSQASNKARLVDLFTGSGSVAWFAAQHLNVPVLAFDLQAYAVCFAKAVLGRTESQPPLALEGRWIGEVRSRLERSSTWRIAQEVDSSRQSTGSWVRRAREACASTSGSGFIWRAYGGHYFSPSQAVLFDLLYRSLPERGPNRSLCHAALLTAASNCVASPGHTAQPFSTSRTAGPYLRQAWMKSPLSHAAQALRQLSKRHARKLGDARVADALNVAGHLNASDLVFVDPPYSGVHYSRFYHVLETLARGHCGPVEGVGRYPDPSERPSSIFSQSSRAAEGFTRLFRSLASVGCTAIVTFPNHHCSNGVSGELVEETASEFFFIKRKMVKTRFSTLGGNNKIRNARKASEELILLLKPR